MKKILVVSSSPFISGAEISLKQFLENVNNEFELTLITGNKEYFNEIRCNNHIVINPIFDKCSLFRFVIETIKINYSCIKKLKGFDPQVIYFNTTNSYLNFIWLSVFFQKSKKIWHVRDTLKSKMAERLLGFLSDKIVCNSKFIYDNFTTGLKKEFIHGGIDVSKYKPTNGLIKNKIERKSDFKLVGCIAQLTPWKNQIDFIKAAKLIYDKNPETRFLIIGDVLNTKDDSYKKKLLDKIDSLGLKEIVKLTGFVDDITELISKIDVIVHPAINEPFGRVLIEAMSMEKPVVAYRSGGVLEIIVHNETGYLIECYNYESLATHTLMLLNDHDLANNLGKKGREVVKEKFSLDLYVKKMQKLLID